MTSSRITESTLEDTALSWLKDLGYEVLFGSDIAFDGPNPERTSATNYGDVVLTKRLREALVAINPNIPNEAIEEAVQKVTRTESPTPKADGATHRPASGGTPHPFKSFNYPFYP